MTEREPVVHTLSLPEYDVRARPEYARLGPRLDAFLAARLPRDRPLALRGIDLLDHPHVSRSNLVATIRGLGTDRYDPRRRSMHHDHFDPLGVDLHAVPCEVTPDGIRGLIDPDYVAADSFGAEFMMDFYDSARAERGYPLRIDLLLAYGLEQLRAVPEQASMSFAFRDPTRKRDALLAIVNVLGKGEG